MRAWHRPNAISPAPSTKCPSLYLSEENNSYAPPKLAQLLSDFLAKRNARDLFTEYDDAHRGDVGQHNHTYVSTGHDRKPALVPANHATVPSGYAIAGNEPSQTHHLSVCHRITRALCEPQRLNERLLVARQIRLDELEQITTRRPDGTSARQRREVPVFRRAQGCVVRRRQPLTQALIQGNARVVHAQRRADALDQQLLVRRTRMECQHVAE